MSLIYLKKLTGKAMAGLLAVLLLLQPAAASPLLVPDSCGTDACPIPTVNESNQPVYAVVSPVGYHAVDMIARLEILGPGRCRVTVEEGKYHLVRRMLASVGAPVTALHRVRVGDLALDEALAPGEFRALTEAEIAAALINT